MICEIPNFVANDIFICHSDECQNPSLESKWACSLVTFGQAQMLQINSYYWIATKNNKMDSDIGQNYVFNDFISFSYFRTSSTKLYESRKSKLSKPSNLSKPLLYNLMSYDWMFGASKPYFFFLSSFLSINPNRIARKPRAAKTSIGIV